MKRHRKLIFSIIISLIITGAYGLFANNRDVKISLTILENKDNVYQIFYNNLINNDFDEGHSKVVNVTGNNQYQTIDFSISKDCITKLRFDFGSQPHELDLQEIRMSQFYSEFTIPASEIYSSFEIKNDITTELSDKKHMRIIATGNDPYIGSMNLDQLTFSDIKMSAVAILVLIFLCMFILFYVGLKMFPSIGSLKLSLKEDLKKILDFAVNDFKRRYAGSYFGIIWAFVQPIVTIVIYWGVFQFGFRSPPVKNFPFLIWFIPGLIPWFFFSDIITGSMSCLLEYSYLVKKVVFKIEILPLMKSLVSAFINAFFILLMIIVYICYGYKPDLYYLQIIYYTFCLALFAIPIAFFTCVVVVFFRDLGQIVNIVLQFGMWITPIVWPADMVPARFQWILKLNPVYYFIQGYRDSLMDKIWFWQHSGQTIYFFIVTGILFIVSLKMFQRLKPHLDDAL